MDWTHFHNKVQFELTDFLFCDAKLSASKVNFLLDLWTQPLSESNTPGPMKDHKELHALIDSSALGNVPWQCMETFFDKDDASPWKQKAYEVWYCNPDIVVSNMLANPNFNGQFDVHPILILMGTKCDAGAMLCLGILLGDTL